MKKLLSVLLVSLVLLPFMAKDVSATIVEVEQNQAALWAHIESHQPSSESFSKNMSDNLQANAILYTMGGHPKEGANGEIVYTRGMIGEMGKSIAWMLGNPAASTERYVADVLDSAGIKIAQPAYAQGLGFASLDPILESWKTFRNLAYLLFVIVFMVIGFLIMMRQKIGGQTVITAQQAIPHIIVALLLVTFSYAIAGLLIDLMYLVMYLLLALFNKDQASFLNKNFFTLGVTMVTSGTSTAYEAVQEFGESLESSLGEIGAEAISFIGSLTMAVVVAVAITLKIFTLFFELLKTYVSIILSIAFSPIILAVGAIPGKDTFKQWITDLIGNLAAFPTVLLVLIIFDTLTDGISRTNEIPIEIGGFQPPYLLGVDGGSGGTMTFIVGVGLLMIMPEIVKKAKTAIGVKDGIFGELAGDIGTTMKGAIRDGGEPVPGLGLKIPALADVTKWSGKQANEQIIRKGYQQLKGRYEAGGSDAIVPTGVQKSRTTMSAPKGMESGRMSDKTKLRKVSDFIQGAEPVESDIGNDTEIGV